MVCIRNDRQGNYQIYGHVRGMYTVLANPRCAACDFLRILSSLISPHRLSGVSARRDFTSLQEVSVFKISAIFYIAVV